MEMGHLRRRLHDVRGMVRVSGSLSDRQAVLLTPDFPTRDASEQGLRAEQAIRGESPLHQDNGHRCNGLASRSFLDFRMPLFVLETIQLLITSTLTFISVLGCIEVILQCQEQGTAVVRSALPKRDILVAELYVTAALVEDVLTFERHREAVLAESLVKFGIEAGGRTEFHILLVATAVPFHIYVHPDVAWQMDGILKLYDSQWITEGLAFALIFPSEPLSDDAGIHLWLPNPDLELCAEESLELLYFWRILHRQQLHFSILTVWFREVDDSILLVLV